MRLPEYGVCFISPQDCFMLQSHLSTQQIFYSRIHQ